MMIDSFHNQWRWLLLNNYYGEEKTDGVLQIKKNYSKLADENYEKVLSIITIGASIFF